MASEALSYRHETMADQEPEEDLFPPCLVEFVGQWLFVFTVQVNVGFGEQNQWDALAIGSILMVMVFMGGHISGGHYNPAVTLGVYLRGKIGRKKALIYVVVQVTSAITASLAGWAITSKHPFPGPGKDFNVGHAFLAEVIYSTALVLVVLNVATTESQEDNSFFGLAIGFIVMVGVFAVGKISGGVFNPAIGTGLTVAHGMAGGNIQYLWLWWVAPCLGACIAAGIFRITNAREFRTTPEKGLRQPLNRSSSEL